MSYRIVTPNGAWRVCGDSALKQRINTLIQRRLKVDSERAAAREAILDHPYLIFNEWDCAEVRYRRERAKRCRGVLEGLKVRLERDEVTQDGLEGATDQAELTVEKLTDHSLRMLDLSDNWFLLSVERHPYGGRDTVLIQYWLYSKHGRRVRRLHTETIMYPKMGETKVRHGEGPWQNPEAAAQEEFQTTVVRLLGTEALEALEKAIQYQESGLCFAPPEVLKKCELVTGIDSELKENAERRNREKSYQSKYGPRPSKGPAGVAIVPGAGMRFGVAPAEPASHDPRAVPA